MKHTLIVFPTFTAQMCGVAMVRKYAKKVELEYLDGTTESAPIEKIGQIDWDSPFSIVGMVQAAARS